MSKRGWGGRPTCASLDLHPEAPVLRGPAGASAQSNSRVSLFSEQCKRHACGLSGNVPMMRAHLRCAFLIMSGGHHLTRLPRPNALPARRTQRSCATKQRSRPQRAVNASTRAVSAQAVGPPPRWPQASWLIATALIEPKAQTAFSLFSFFSYRAARGPSVGRRRIATAHAARRTAARC